MPILIKNKTKKAPGIVVFTHNEILKGVTRKSSKVDNLLSQSYKNNEWIFGVHIQGDCSNVYNWPYKDWQRFFLWPQKDDPFLSKIPKTHISELTCVNFLSEKIGSYNNSNKDIDIVSVGRFSSLKKIDLTLKIFKGLLDINPNYKFVLIALRPENVKNFFQKKEKALGIEMTEEEYLKRVEESLREIKNNEKYNNLKIIDPVIKKNELFPIPEENIYEYISRSKYHMLNSHREGVPRVLIESLYLNTKVIISNQLKFGLKKFLNSSNSFIYDDKINNIEKIIDDINKKLQESIDYSKKFIEKENFEENKSKKLLVSFLQNLNAKKFFFEEIGHPSWKLDNLKFRLCSHFNEIGHQIMKNEKTFLEWFKLINENENFEDEKSHYIFERDKLDIILNIKFFFIEGKKLFI